MSVAWQRRGCIMCMATGTTADTYNILYYNGHPADGPLHIISDQLNV